MGYLDSLNPEHDEVSPKMSPEITDTGVGRIPGNTRSPEVEAISPITGKPLTQVEIEGVGTIAVGPDGETLIDHDKLGKLLKLGESGIFLVRNAVRNVAHQYNHHPPDFAREDQSNEDLSELESRLKELAPMVEAMYATEGQLPPEKQAQLLERIADNALERRLKELAPMVEAVQATEGQLPPEKTELLLKQIAEGAAKRKLQARDEALWKELASAIARVPVALRKEWAKLPELLDKLPDPQSWLRAHLQTFDESVVSTGSWRPPLGGGYAPVGGGYAPVGGGYFSSGRATPASAYPIEEATPAPAYPIEEATPAPAYSIEEEIPRPKARYARPVLRLWLFAMLLILAGAAGLVWMIGWLWMIGVLGGIGLLWLCSRLISPPRTAAESPAREPSPPLYPRPDVFDRRTGERLPPPRTAAESPVVAEKVARPLSPSECDNPDVFDHRAGERLPSHVELELGELMKKSLQSFAPAAKDALRVNLIELPELFKNTPDARFRWEKLLSHENLIAGDVLFTGKSLHSGEDLYIAELPMPRGLPVSTARQPGLPEERYQGQKIGEYWESMGLLSGHFFCDRQGGMLFAPDFPRSLAVQTPVPNISRVWVREVQGLCANASELLVAPWTTPMAKCKVGDTDILVGKCGIWFNGARGLKDAFIHMLGPDYGMSRPMPYRNSFIAERLAALSHGFSSLMEDMVQSMDAGIEPKERHKDLDYYISLPIEDRLNCSTCLSEFDVTNVLWVATHSSLEYDSLLGDGHFLRFVPSQFSIEGEVLDSKGSVCTQTACPECHCILPYESVSALTENPTTSPSQ